MLRGARFQLLAVLAVGAGLGYLMAAGKLALPTRSHAAVSSAHPALVREALPASQSCDTCCSSAATKNLMLAMAAPGATAAGNSAQVASKKPNILVIFGDDIGQSNISAYTMGLMGYRTPNIDRLAREGMLFTDYYAEQSCTAGRSTFITGQCTFRTGLSKVGMPGAQLGLQKEDPTIAELLKPMGYVTGQFGKNHLGDRDEYLPTKHGFDEFFGNLYHLNAEEEPEHRNYPRDPEFRKRFGPRGVLRSFAGGKIEDTGPLTRKRMETIDDETSAAAIDFIDRQHKAGKPFFCWFNSTRMHFRTHVKPEKRSPPGFSALTEYADGMIEHDGHVGLILKKLDDLGIVDDTIVLYTTDNGPHMNSWPDSAMTPFRSEKNSCWEGAFRVPAFLRWPGKVKAGSVSNAIVSGLDWMPTLLAAAGEPGIKESLLKGYAAGDKTFKVHLDGFNLLPFLTGQTQESPRHGFFYFNDDGDMVALRYANWKILFAEQRAPGTMRIWAEPFTLLRVPKIYDLRADPYERADITSNSYYDWLLDHAFLLVPSQQLVGEFLATFKEFPPRQKAASFTIDQVMGKLRDGIAR